MKKILTAIFLVLSISYSLVGEEVASSGKEELKIELDRGTSLYDADSVAELFLSYKAENEERAAKAAAEIDYEDMEIVELKGIEVKSDDFLNQKALLEELNPEPMNRIRRLSRVNPNAAYDLQVAARNEENFFSDSAFATDSNTGSSAQLSVDQMAGAVEATFNKLSNLFGKKKSTGDGR